MVRPPANYKRLIVLCDGSWQSILDVNTPSHPSNVARFARAISPTAIVKDKDNNESEVEQIVYYQPGVGTGVADKLSGGVYGAGLSANVRAAYAFLAHNWDPNPGDEIFFFGFSRGAYTARSIAGLVTNLGLLTKRGMDWFPQVYDAYYKDAGKNPNFVFPSALKQVIGNDLNEDARYAVKVVGVWDTVEFHGEGWGGEKIEFHNAELSPKVQYGYHAMSLDERRMPYVPTLWQWPKDPHNNSQLYQPTSDGKGLQIAKQLWYGKGLQVMKQAWFSGVHTDIGGGRYDPGGSDITLAWMLAQVSKDKKLAFTDEDSDDYYLLPDKSENPNTNWTRLHTRLDPEPKEKGIMSAITSKVMEMAEDDRKAFPLENTFERIHRSIADRDFGQWPCGMLEGTSRETSHGMVWDLKTPGKFGNELMVQEGDEVADRIEDRYRERVRALPGSKGGPAIPAKL